MWIFASRSDARLDDRQFLISSRSIVFLFWNKKKTNKQKGVAQITHCTVEHTQNRSDDFVRYSRRDRQKKNELKMANEKIKTISGTHIEVFLFSLIVSPQHHMPVLFLSFVASDIHENCATHKTPRTPNQSRGHVVIFIIFFILKKKKKEKELRKRKKLKVV